MAVCFVRPGSGRRASDTRVGQAQEFGDVVGRSEHSVVLFPLCSKDNNGEINEMQRNHGALSRLSVEYHTFEAMPLCIERHGAVTVTLLSHELRVALRPFIPRPEVRKPAPDSMSP